jgi:hypothetical protein
MTSVVNNDAALLACAFTALAAVAAMRRFPTSPYPSVAFAVAALLGVLAKPTLLFYLPALFACAVAGLGASRRAVVQAAALLVPAIVAGVLWLVLHPPPEVAAPVQLSFGQFFQDQVWNGQRAKWLWVTSYWMTWGWADTMLPERYYLLVVAMLAGAAVGLVIGWRLLLTSERAVAALALVVSAYCVVVLYALEYFLMRRTPTAAFIQGRYLLPFLPLVLLAAITGWAAVGRRFRATVDLRWVVPLVLLTLDMAAAIHALHRYHA